MWEIIKDRSDKANMTDRITSYDTVGFHPLQEIPADRIECFEDLYLSARMGLWMQGTRETHHNDYHHHHYHHHNFDEAVSLFCNCH